jgi:DeoR/GlpR family transcriptional regulator of sugar metabolism
MKRDRKSVDERRMKVLDMVREQKEVSVEQLAEIFQVSLMTVRRDLHYLEERGLLDRFYGGATVQKRWPDAPEEDIQLCREKIAQYAARFVEEGDRLFINGSMTALNMLVKRKFQYLPTMPMYYQAHFLRGLRCA